MQLNIIGDRIKTARKEKGLSHKQLAEKLNIAQSTISMYENGHREPDYKTLRKIAESLDVHPSYFFLDNEGEKLDLLEVLRGKKLTWGDQELTEEEKQRALEMMRILLNK